MDVVVNPMVSRLVETLVVLGSEELRSILGVPEEIQKLRDTLHSIQAVLNDAERRQISEQGVKQWLSRLTDVMYDADDILDEYRVMAEEWASRERTPEEPSIGCRMLPFFGCFRRVKFTHEIGSKIRDLNQRLERISADRSKFHLKVDISVPDRQKVGSRVRFQTSPGVEPDIVGEVIEKDTRDLVDLLMRKKEDENVNLVALAIVGIGGIGKTTLAQKIFNHDEIKNAFQKKRMWVCVSQEFVETDLLREIITSTGGSPGEARSKAQLENMVMHLLKDSKFLLVLDDVWDAQIWEDFFSKPLQVGAVGSKVLVTTRNQRVTKRMKAIHIHCVNPLTPHDSWLLLCKKVTKSVEEERDVESLKDIGMKIVEKCQGLPLAITAIGGVLCGEFNRWKWQEVELSSAWSRTGLPDGVHQALYLSYQDLPSHLKQCLLYCSLFREDSTLLRESLAQLWIAEGFVVKLEGEEYLSMEEIAQGYFDELIQRSLLQNLGKAKYEGIYCKMHDLLRSLCHSLARGESSVIRDTYKQIQSTANEDSIKLRRLSIVAPEYEDVKPFLRSIQRHKSVRTLLLEKITSFDDEDIDSCFKNFRHLRVVYLGKTMIRSLPQSVGNLLHLRYLNLFGCGEVKALPESIASLTNLQFLILQGCLNLHTLPKGVVKLHNLRTLDLANVPLEELPSGIARLKDLNELKGAVVSSISNHSSNSHSSSCSLEEISKLRKLRELSIHKLDMTSDESVEEINGLNGLKLLEELVVLDLFCGSFGDFGQQVASYTAEETDRIEKIFDVALHPPFCVRQILIQNFFGCQFPRWLISSSISSFLPNLTNLELISCRNCSLLPPLGKLLNLEYLVLYKLDALTSIGAEFFGFKEASTSIGHESGVSKSLSSSLALFPRLKRLRLSFLDNLEIWHWVPEDGGTVAMPQLNELEVSHCPKLLSLPMGLNRQAIHLTELFINGTNINSISGFPCVKYMSIHGGTGLKIVSDLPRLEVLEVHLNEEESLSLPDWLVQGLPHFTSLQRLDLACENEQLIRRCLPNGPDWPKVSHIPIVEITHRLGYYMTYIKHSSTFQTNII